MPAPAHTPPAAPRSCPPAASCTLCWRTRRCSSSATCHPFTSIARVRPAMRCAALCPAPAALHRAAGGGAREGLLAPPALCQHNGASLPEVALTSTHTPHLACYAVLCCAAPAGRLFVQLVDLLRFYMSFPIHDHTGDPLGQDEVDAAQYEKVGGGCVGVGVGGQRGLAANKVLLLFIYFRFRFFFRVWLSVWVAGLGRPSLSMRGRAGGLGRWGWVPLAAQAKSGGLLPCSQAYSCSPGSPAQPA